MTEPERVGDSEPERAVAGAAPAFTAEEAARLSGLDPAIAKRLWRAFGFPEYGEAVAFTHPDVAALDTLARTVDSRVIDLDTAVNLTRALGQTMARLADWQVATLATQVQLLEELEAPFEELMVYAWRRHLAAAIARTAAPTEAELARTGRLTVGFADMVAFTTLSNTLREDRIGDLVEVFESRCADVVAGRNGRVIKSLGDSVLFVNDDAVRAVETAEGIITVIGRDARMPDVRVGLATGSVVMQLGDVFGPPVNLAARLTGVARRNRLIVDAETAAALPTEVFETRPLPGRPVRGFGIVEPLAVRRH